HLRGQAVSTLVFLASGLIGLLSYLWYHLAHFGWNLILRGEVWRKDAPPIFSGDLPRGALGQLFDRDFGLFTYAPVYVFLFAGWFLFKKENPKAAFGMSFLGTPFFLLFSLCTPECWSGAAAPGRMILPVLPVLAPLLARAGEE